MFTLQENLPSRIQEEVQIYNMSLPIPHEVLPHEHQENLDGLGYEYEPLLDELLKTAECPVCRCIPTPPIYNCMNGHFTCNSCLPRLPSGKCGYCLAKFTKMRNYPLEQLVTVRTFGCDFHSSGCKLGEMSMAEYEEHVRTCSFRPIQIPPKSRQPNQVNRILMSKDNNMLPPQVTDTYPQALCPRCNYSNSTRKLKCQNCDLNLRIATPMSGRHVLGSPGN